MRSVALLLALLALPPLAAADVGHGNGFGVDGGEASAGLWDIWHVYVGAPGSLAATVTWVDSPGGADYDLTLWAPGADQDGVLAQSEIVATAWHHRRSPRIESLSAPVAANAAAYVLTVEAIQGKGETYTLQVTGGALVRTCHPLSPQFTCLPGAQGVKTY